MSLTYGWYLSSLVSWDKVIEFAQTAINHEGLTDLRDRVPVDIRRSFRGPHRVEPVEGAAARILGIASTDRWAGSLRYEIGSYLELGECIVVSGLLKETTFEGFRCLGIDARLESLDAWLGQDPPDRAPTEYHDQLRDLRASLALARAWRVAVVFGS